ncbi:GntR family transcriptional regulator [[Clostridium] sordellii]|uniref:GntR family transcriptional regulator n=1 Tax=Paraclostridium sordellii TaxID=1505 RepID=A0A9P1KXQ9_PARSO|nr:FadR/GntR family transcriptional regulator [Paeniclostridium sordellii]AUN14947.1 GntR family transcriptional regulator [Paeniclostridium sordellii]EPZ59571.1 bacterial regulatory s, gntR family protein [[Clostridium] sordellii VPI 9048] [Paeniclostridium sordellii VPI 9048]MBS6024759.1 FadR family transcriptional regulator [Paeniclostridium sordellii]MBX9181412.1 FadR family transcriptional regulator [Paeniclostridium sordellii]MCQ4698691.1 FadR family transcriptional regulator [Paeniclost
MFSNITNKKIYQQVISQIQDMILSGKLKKGDKLMSERELSEKMGVSRTSIREALRVLETMGIIESRQGEGNFICNNIETSLIQPLSMMFILNNGSYEDILELRSMIELEAVKLAATRGTEEEFEELKKISQELTRNDKIYNKGDIDKEIHYKIACMSKNFLIKSLYKISLNLLEDFIINSRQKIVDYYHEEDTLNIQHKKICDSIIARDPENAYIYMKEHLDLIKITMEKI